jgi:hypothetical protein
MGLLSFIKKMDPIGWAGAREGLRIGQQAATLNDTLPNPLNINEKNGKLALQPTRGALPPPQAAPGPGPSGPVPGQGGVGLMAGMPQQQQMIQQMMAQRQQMPQPGMAPPGAPPQGGQLAGMLPDPNAQNQGGGLLRIRNMRGGY